jgi:competence protein ComEA
MASSNTVRLHGKAHRSEINMVRNKHSGWFASLAASIVAALALVLATTGIAAAAVEVNSADQSQLETVKGIGPSLSSKILAARKQGTFKDWSDLQTRVSGVGEKNSAGFSRNGLTVGGKAKDGAEAQASAGRSAKAAASKKPAADGTTTVASAKKAS